MARKSAASTVRPRAAASLGANITTGYSGESSVTGPCWNSAPLNASACTWQVSLSLRAASRAIDRVGRRPKVAIFFAPASVSSAVLQSSSAASASRSGSRSMALRIVRLPAHSVASRSRIDSDAMKDFVAAMLRSGPASMGRTRSQSAARGLPVSLTTATVIAPSDFDMSANSRRSSLWPDCEMTRTS